MVKFKEYLVEDFISESFGFNEEVSGASIDQKLYQVMKNPAIRQAVQNQMQNGVNSQAASQGQVNQWLDIAQTGLDIAGWDPEPISGGIINGTNAAISAGRAYYDKDNRQQHMINALVNLIGVVPMGKLASLLKAGKYGRTAAKGAVLAGQAAKGVRAQKAVSGVANIGGQLMGAIQTPQAQPQGSGYNPNVADQYA